MFGFEYSLEIFESGAAGPAPASCILQQSMISHQSEKRKISSNRLTGNSKAQ
jgi:hypothetical protein